MALARQTALAGLPLRGVTAANLDYGLISSVEVLQKVVESWSPWSCEAHLDVRHLQ